MGQKRPYRVTFKWSNGVKGANAYPDTEAARFFVKELLMTSGRRDGITAESIVYGHRDRPAENVVVVQDGEVLRPFCEHFAYCTNDATLTLKNPAVGEFRSCQSCADKMERIRNG